MTAAVFCSVSFSVMPSRSATNSYVKLSMARRVSVRFVVHARPLILSKWTRLAFIDCNKLENGVTTSIGGVRIMVNKPSLNNRRSIISDVSISINYWFCTESPTTLWQCFAETARRSHCLASKFSVRLVGHVWIATATMTGMICQWTHMHIRSPSDQPHLDCNSRRYDWRRSRPRSCNGISMNSPNWQRLVYRMACNCRRLFFASQTFDRTPISCDNNRRSFPFAVRKCNCEPFPSATRRVRNWSIRSRFVGAEKVSNALNSEWHEFIIEPTIA